MMSTALAVSLRDILIVIAALVLQQVVLARKAVLTHPRASIDVAVDELGLVS
jgi:hypothetical protein